MLPKNYRLTKKNDFAAVFKKGQSVKYGFLVCRAVKNNLPMSRFGFVVSKKISNKATIRNKVRRRLQNAVAGQLQNIKKPFDVVMVTLPGIEKKEFKDYQVAISMVFKKMGIL